MFFWLYDNISIIILQYLAPLRETICPRREHIFCDLKRCPFKNRKRYRKIRKIFAFSPWPCYTIRAKMEFDPKMRKFERMLFKE